ncbi:MAG: hypothetical protein D6701_00970, partial [Gemmatimonadetes bacterium]
DGRLVLIPPRALGISSTAEITTFPGMRFDELREAPTDTAAYVRDEPVPVALGTTYVFRTHRDVDQIGQTCFFYGKMEPLSISVEQGTLEFIFDVNPVCQNPDLVPPDNN